MGRWIAGALMVLGLLSGCTPAGPPSPTGSPEPTATPSTGPTTSASPSSQAPATPAPTPATSSPSCDFLPPGVDPRACTVASPAPAPVPESTEFPGLYVLSADGGRIRCDLNGYGEFVACTVASRLTPEPSAEECDAGDWDNDFVYLWRAEEGDWAAGQGACRGDPLTSEMAEPPALPEGSVLTDGDVAVLAVPDGIVVWNGAAQHGLAVLGDRVVTW